MSAAKHTPGPWTVVPGSHTRIGVLILTEQPMYAGAVRGAEIGRVRNIADARLIAAAPDLYALAQAVARRTATGISDQELIGLARAALAKVSP